MSPNSDPDDTVLMTQIEAQASVIGLDIPAECLPGVLANTRILRRYAAMIDERTFDHTVEPAYEYTP